MSTPTTVSETPAPYGTWTAFAPDRVILLSGVRWETYCALLEDTGDGRRCQMAYGNGELELMAPSGEHEDLNFQIHDLITVLLRELKMPYRALGHMTTKRDRIKQGVEPDLCYYIQSYPLMRGKRGKELDAQQNPVPDLMVEVDVHHNSTMKREICEALGILELWRINNERLEIRVLRNGQYEVTEDSAAFPGIRVQKIAELLYDQKIEEYERATVFEDWVREQLKPRPGKKNA